MELEEAVKYLKNINDKDLWIKGYVYGTEAIEIVLKELENSISKDKIKEERTKCYKEAGSYDIDNATIKQHKLIGGFEVLNKLLEDKI